jgi:hypothetical protein
MPAQFESAIVRIWSEDEEIVGMGFLIDNRRVLTCAHVVTSTLGIPDDAPDLPTDKIRLDFPLVAPGDMLTAKVIFWPQVQFHNFNESEHEEDIAGLELDAEPPVGAHPVSLVLTEDLWNHKFRAFGFPDGHEDGMWTSGVLRVRQTDDWVRIQDVKKTGYFILPGFSGGPVWDERLNGVVGMVVAADTHPGVRAAFIIPTEVLISIWPELSKRMREKDEIE